jgi:monofunctional biosynthetic peptidoglycan transglycosylase
MKALLRWLLLVALAVLALQLFFVLRIAAMAAVNPESTTFQRSEAWAQSPGGQLRWRQQWVPYAQISDHLKRAVIASEDDDFVNHDGVDWNAIEKPGNATPRPKQNRRPGAAHPTSPVRPRRPRSSAAPPSPSNWPRTCCSRASAPCCARARNLC